MPKQATAVSSVELSHYATVLRRRWRAVVVGILLGVVVATALVLNLPTRATAVTLVNVNLISANAFNSQRPPSDLLDMQTEQTMARSTVVMDAVAGDLGGDWETSSVRSATEATLLPDGTVLRIEFTAPDADAAADGAALVAEKYLAYRSEEAQGRVDVAAERLVSRRNTLNRQLAQANAKIAATPESGSARLAAEMERQSIADELSAVSSQLNELRAVDTTGGSILTEADADQVSVRPNRPLVLASGILGGVLLGLVLAFVANVLDRRVRDSYDVAGAGGGITVVRLVGGTAEVPASADDADSLRAVRERLLSTGAGSHKIFSVIDVGERTSWPSDVAVNLAVALADSGMRTDLVLADYPAGALHQVLTALQVTEAEPVGVVRCFRHGFDSSLTVLVPAPGRQRLSTADIVSDLLADVRSADAVVVGVAQAAGPAVRLSAGRASDQVLLAVEEMSTRIDDLAQAATDLLAVQADIHGTVLVPRGRRIEGTDDHDGDPLGLFGHSTTGGFASRPAPVEVAAQVDLQDVAADGSAKDAVSARVQVVETPRTVEHPGGPVDGGTSDESAEISADQADRPDHAEEPDLAEEFGQVGDPDRVEESDRVEGAGHAGETDVEATAATGAATETTETIGQAPDEASAISGDSASVVEGRVEEDADADDEDAAVGATEDAAVGAAPDLNLEACPDVPADSSEEVVEDHAAGQPDHHGADQPGSQPESQLEGHSGAPAGTVEEPSVVSGEDDAVVATHGTERVSAFDVIDTSVPPDAPVVANHNSWAFTR